ncbi:MULTISPECIES: RluA family pseudouridine synthase [Paenibacillus]|uniref:RluA family pseudouridine synthase n=1 Tax=Paenibacillus TaxID=44249 RepID=UPI0003F733C4|nr:MULTISPECIES: RluA family pseudouridine synthase [Paenibacillus]KEO80323.1 pseudouridine synthase [Paenibacillus polymyxa]MCH6186435.1 RluA family pseudouridine synthase [Paenibacillus polymyxa]UMY56208.1 RluA family pseudouridine synthase [Paenibacillus peoriae]WRL60573.1 RluA family pseudouridine synthase [Paenibacillus polymyxa]
MNNRKPQRKNHTKSTSNASHSKRSHKPAGRSGSHRPEAPRGTNAFDKAPAKTYIVQEPAELLSFLVEHVTGMGRNSIKSALARGQVSVNGIPRTVYNFPLEQGQTVALSKEKVIPVVPLTGLRILHEDEAIIVIHKDAGLLSVASAQEQEVTAYRQLTAHVRREHPYNRIFVLHRLDRDTSGVMMFAKSEAIQQEMQKAWKEVVYERTYIALVEGQVKKAEGTITSWLKESKTLKMYSSPYPNDGQHAVTHYKLLQANRHFSLLEVRLETGRKNQIRVHMEDIGHPIVGDKKYGSKSKSIGRLGLHARVLSFIHPVTGVLLRFESDIPKTFLNPFRE